ncbi:LCP family protein [Xylanimonas allomyrinae]|uniref:LCP family protein n=1 Tax=Xylanimonas allomyrinae TaxID=2509459 RepID=UPI001FE69499|nr:LCP family protein [Xylanimonas allomyrinae]
MTDAPRIPPSFSPSGAQRRPAAADDVVPVRGQRREGVAPRSAVPDDAVVGGQTPRVRRQSSREVPVTPPANRARASARPRPAAAPRPQSFEPGSAPRRPMPDTSGGAPRSADGRPAAPQAFPPRGSAGATRAPVGSARPSAHPTASGGPSLAGGGASRPGVASPRPARTAPAPVHGPAGAAPQRRRRRKGRIVALTAALALVLLLAWPVGLLIWANGKIQHTEALSGAAGTPGTTYLLAGSDARGSGGIEDETSGARTDTIMLLHKPSSGPAALLSLPRDSFVEIPGHGSNKLNAAFSFGGAPLLVQTVEQLTGLTVDHYVEVGFGGISGVVDAVGGVNLCLDLDVDDANSGLQWTKGCHDVDGTTAIAFSRMRYADPQGDIGRTDRQRQLINAVTGKVADPGLVFRPGRRSRSPARGSGR